MMRSVRAVGLAVVPAVAILCATARPALADTPRDALVQASFGEGDKAAALARVVEVQQAATAILHHTPGDWEAALVQATAIGYRAKLTGSRGDAIVARKQFEALVARNPNNADAQLGLGAWHVGAVYNLGRFMSRAALGAQKDVGLAALDRAVALGGGRAVFPGLAGLLRLELDPTDDRGRALAEAATHAATPTRFDRIMQRAAAAVLVPLRAGDTKTTRAMAARLLPFGRLDKK